MTVAIREGDHVAAASVDGQVTGPWRSPYCQPQLVYYGTVAKLTQAFTGSVPDSVGQPGRVPNQKDNPFG